MADDTVGRYAESRKLLREKDLWRKNKKMLAYKARYICEFGMRIENRTCSASSDEGRRS
jgi:hypothetical protein